MPHRVHCKDRLPELEKDDAGHVAEALGPMPRAALTAMVDYGLSDVEISQYFKLATDTVTFLRQYYGDNDNC